MMRLVIIESPYAGDIDKNVKFARACVKDSLSRGEAPIASHLLYTQEGILDDNIPEERQQGIDAGLAWRTKVDASVVYTDLGISKGMEYGIKAAEEAGIPVILRRLGSKFRYVRETIHTDPDMDLIQGDLLMNKARYVARWKGRNVKLTTGEFNMLYLLASRPEIIRTRSEIMDEIVGLSAYLEERSIDSHVKRTRNKFKVVDPSFDAIKTVYSGGYKFSLE